MTSPVAHRATRALLAVSFVALAGCSSIRGERVAVSEDGFVHQGAISTEPARTDGIESVPAVVEIGTDVAASAAMRFTATLLDGGATTGRELSAGRPLHVVFLQPTCRFSGDEAPELASAARRNPGITYLVAHSGGEVDDYRRTIATAALDAPNIVHVDDSDRALWNRFGVEATPSSILVDRTGRMRSSYGALGESGLDRAAGALLAGF